MMMWVRAVWNEEGTEEEGTVPVTWIRDGLLYWPNTSNALRTMLSGKVPTASWRTFPVIKEKFRSECRDECEAYDLTTAAETEEEDYDSEGPSRSAHANQRQRKKKVFKDFCSGFESGDSATVSTEPAPKKARPNNKSTDTQLPRPPAKPHLREKTPSPREMTPPPLLSTPVKEMTPSNLDSSTLWRDLSPSPRQSLRKSPTGWSARLAANRSRSPRRSPRHLNPIPSDHRSATPQAERHVAGHLISPQSTPRRPLPFSSASERLSPRRKSQTEWPGRIQPRTSSSSSSQSQSSGSQLYPLPPDVFQRKVIQVLAEIKLELKEIRKTELGLPGHIGDIPLMAKTYEELMKIEASLKTPQDCRKLTVALSRVGGNSTSENARRILKKLMTYDTMALFSLKGKKGKRPFQSLNIFKAIKDAVVQTMACTEAAAELAIASALKYAPDRQGGGGRRRDGHQ